MSEGHQKRPIDYMWPLIGLTLRTGIIGALLLSTDVRIRGVTGMICGGIPFGFIGLRYAMRRARRTIE